MQGERFALPPLSLPLQGGHLYTEWGPFRSRGGGEGMLPAYRIRMPWEGQQ